MKTKERVKASQIQPRLIRKWDVARMLSVSNRKVDQFVVAGMPRIEIGSKLRLFEPDVVMKWIKENAARLG